MIIELSNRPRVCNCKMNHFDHYILLFYLSIKSKMQMAKYCRYILSYHSFETQHKHTIESSSQHDPTWLLKMATCMTIYGKSIKKGSFGIAG